MTTSGSEPMIAAEALASLLMRLILPFIFLRSRSTRERLPSASERLPPAFCWMATTMREEARLGHRHALRQLGDRLGERNAERLGLDDRAEFAADRLGRLVGDDAAGSR